MSRKSNSYYAVRGGEYARDYYEDRKEREREREKSPGGSSKKSSRSKRRDDKVVVRDYMPVRGFDENDRAPEDRFNQQCRPLSGRGSISDLFDTYDSVVRGTFHIEGVNYSKYESYKDVPERSQAFLDAIKDDVISEVGNGVRREDIRLRVYPGAIKTVVLHYDDHDARDAVDPRLVDAEWNLKVDYGIRARDAQRQQNIAMALFSAFTSSYGFSDGKTKFAYKRYIDKNVADITKIRIVRPVDDPNAEGQQHQQQRAQGGALGQSQGQAQGNYRPAISPPRPHSMAGRYAPPAAIPAPSPPGPVVGYPAYQPVPMSHASSLTALPADRAVFDGPSEATRLPPLHAPPVPAPQHPGAGGVAPSYLLPPHSPDAAPPFDAKRDAELARLTDDIYRERLKLRSGAPSSTAAGPGAGPLVSGSISPVAPERPYHANHQPSYTAMKTRHASASDYSVAETQFVTTEF